MKSKSKEVLDKTLNELLKYYPDISYTISNKNNKKNIFTISFMINKSYTQNNFVI